MRTRNIAIGIASSLAVGILLGHVVTRLILNRQVEEYSVLANLNNVTSAYIPLKLMRDGRTNEAIVFMKSDLNGALGTIHATADVFKRADLLTNTIVIQAQELQRKLQTANNTTGSARR